MSTEPLHLSRDGDRFVLARKNNGEPLILFAGAPMLPVVDGERVAAVPAPGEPDGLLAFALPGGGPLAALGVGFRRVGDSVLELWCELTAARACQLNALAIAPKGSGLNLYEVVNFRNRHFTPRTWPELLIGGEFETTTYSNDWQFAPHPSALLLRKGPLALFAGVSGLQASFGMRMKARQRVLETWEIDFGAAPHGLPLAAGERWASAPLRLWLAEEPSSHAVFSGFGEMLVGKGEIPDPAARMRAEWWREPVYCTWGDQWMRANVPPAVDLADQVAGEALPAAMQLSAGLVREAVAVIRRERLPVRTIILDEGWAVARGEWRPRIENFRALVDELHAQGFKVMIWWNWAEIADEAEVPEWQLAGGGWRNRHGHRWRDYSDPRVRTEYLEPLFRQLFSSEPGCYDLDGVKTDFLADKVHPETPLADPSWRGEERYFYNVTAAFHEIMRRYKPDAMHMGCAGHYWLARWNDLNRTYDVHSSDYREHEERGRMLTCTTPGTPVSYDMMASAENTLEYFRSAGETGASIQLGQLLTLRDNPFASVREPDAAYYGMLREGCRIAGWPPAAT